MSHLCSLVRFFASLTNVHIAGHSGVHTVRAAPLPQFFRSFIACKLLLKKPRRLYRRRKVLVVMEATTEAIKF